jgi:hypothetical protein
MDRLVLSSLGVSTPIYRPLIGLQKDEIAEFGKKSPVCDHFGSGEGPMASFGQTFVQGGAMMCMQGRGRKPGFNMRVLSFDIGNQFDPVDRAALGSLLWPNDGDIVLMQYQNTVENGEMAAVWLKAEKEVTLKKVLCRIK